MPHTIKHIKTNATYVQKRTAKALQHGIFSIYHVIIKQYLDEALKLQQNYCDLSRPKSSKAQSLLYLGTFC